MRHQNKNPISFINRVLIIFNTYFSLIADTGHVPMQEWQSIQEPSSHCDLPSSSSESAVTGQAPTQAPQPMQTSLSTVTGMLFVLLLIKLYHPRKILQCRS